MYNIPRGWQSESESQWGNGISRGNQVDSINNILHLFAAMWLYRLDNLHIGFPTNCEADDQNIAVTLGETLHSQNLNREYMKLCINQEQLNLCGCTLQKYALLQTTHICRA